MAPLMQRHRLAALPLSAFALIATLLWQPDATQQIVILLLFAGCIGLPHGLTDFLLLSGLARRCGWPEHRPFAPLFGSAIYLLISLMYLLIWWNAPLFALLLFLAIAILHFGMHDAQSLGLASWQRSAFALARGVMIIAIPYGTQPDTAAYFTLLAASDVFSTPSWSIWLGCLCIAIQLFAAWRTQDWFVPLETLLLGFALAVMPPLLSFSLYFCIWHTPRHYLLISKKPIMLRKCTINPLTGLFFFTASSFLLVLILTIVDFYYIKIIQMHAASWSVGFFILLSSLTLPHVIASSGREYDR